MDFAGGKPGNAEAEGAVEEAAAEKVGAEEPEGGVGEGRARKGGFTLFEFGFGPEAGVFLAAGPMIGGVAEGIVVEVAGEGNDLAGGFEAFVDFAAGEMGAVAAEETGETIRIPIAVANPTAFVKNAAGHAVAGNPGRGRIGFDAGDFVVEFGGKGFVGIDAEDPVVRSAGKDGVFLGDVALPGLVFETGIVGAGDFGGAVGAAGIENDDFVGEAAKRGEAAVEVVLFVEGDEAEGDFHAGRWRWCKRERSKELTQSSQRTRRAQRVGNNRRPNTKYQGMAKWRKAPTVW